MLGAREPQPLSPSPREPEPHKQRGRHSERGPAAAAQPRSPQLEKSLCGRHPAQPKIKKKNLKTTEIVQAAAPALDLPWLALCCSHSQAPQRLRAHAQALPARPPERASQRPSSSKLPRASLALSDPPGPFPSPPRVSRKGRAVPGGRTSVPLRALPGTVLGSSLSVSLLPSCRSCLSC